MDPGTLAGLALTFGAILVSMIMEGSSPMSLLAIPAMILVLGGTLGTAMTGGLLKDSIGIIGWLKVALLSKAPSADELVTAIVALAETARREGLLALEEAARKVEDPFLRRGLELAVDGTDSEELREILEAEIAAKQAHDKSGAKIFADMGGFAPTLGIIGTVIGLVHVLENLSSPAKLGHLIAGAFIATLWGVLTANAIWLPLGNKVNRLSAVEVGHMELVVEGIMSIQAGTSPRILHKKLTSYLPPGSVPDAEAA